MKKSRFNIILILMSMALVGLLLLQFFWITNVHFVTTERFHSDVNEALEETVLDLEKEEAANVMNLDAFRQSVQGTYTNFVMSEFGNIMNAQESIHVTDTTIISGEERYKFLVVKGTTIDTTTGLRAEHRVITKDFGELMPSEVENSVLSLNDSNSFAIQLTESYERQIMIKAQHLNEMISKLFANNLFDDIRLRVNPVSVDSILTKNLKKHKVDTNYTYNIVHKEEGPVDFFNSSYHLASTSSDSTFKTKLFPNDIVPSKYALILDFPEERFFIWKEMAGTLLGSLVLVTIVVIAFFMSVKTIYRQKQLSEIKNDFISNMTHELKTPISTISLACESIKDPDVMENADSMQMFVDMISQENKRLGKLVENVLQTSLLDKGELKLNLEQVRIDRLVKDSIDAAQLRFQDKGGQVTLKNADAISWHVDRIHFGNILYNLLDNSLKYCDTEPRVEVELNNISNGFELIVTDNGIGIRKEDQTRIFDKLYRVPTGDVHNVKGFGLGLSYVNSVVELHGGEIELTSALGKGSTFKIRIKNE